MQRSDWTRLLRTFGQQLAYARKVALYPSNEIDTTCGQTIDRIGWLEHPDGSMYRGALSQALQFHVPWPGHRAPGVVVFERLVVGVPDCKTRMHRLTMIAYPQESRAALIEDATLRRAALANLLQPAILQVAFPCTPDASIYQTGTVGTSPDDHAQVIAMAIAAEDEVNTAEPPAVDLAGKSAGDRVPVRVRLRRADGTEEFHEVEGAVVDRTNREQRRRDERTKG